MQEDDSVKPFQTVGAHRDLIHCVCWLDFEKLDKN